MKKIITSELKKLLSTYGADLVGVGDLAELPGEARENMPFGISIAVAIDPAVIRGIAEGPTNSYLESYHVINRRLDELVKIGAKYIEDCGYRANARTKNSVKVDEDGLNTVLPHKTIATRSGLGWIGKCALLVTKEYGAAVRLSSIITDAPLIADTPINEAGCGSCTECVKACPGKAVKDINWNIRLEREAFFDPVKCKQASREAAKKHVNVEMSLCGKCIQVCPFTQRYIRKQL